MNGRKGQPILFSGQMVRALLEGRKTVMRQHVKPQPEVSSQGNLCGEWLSRPLGGLLLPRLSDIAMHCPYGQPGDRLWVQEGWAAHFMYDDVLAHNCRSGHPEDNYWYRADGEGSAGSHGCPAAGRRGRWRAPICMPAFASRILLEVTAVRVERLQDISERQAVAEGIHSYPHQWRDCEYPLPDVAYESAPGSKTRYSSPVDAFRDLWESINGIGSWATNPWVWCVEFRRVTP